MYRKTKKENNRISTGVPFTVGASLVAAFVALPNIAQAQGQAPPGTPTSPTNPANPAGQTQNGQPGVTGPGGVRRPGSENESPDFDLSRTVQNAITASSQLQLAQRNVQIDERRADEEAAQNRPNISGNASATRYDAPTKVGLGAGAPIEVTPNHLEQASLQITQRLDLLGQIRASTNQARLQTLSDRILLTQITNERILQAQTIYFNLLRASHQVQVTETALRNAQAQRDVARRLYEGGIGQKIDFLRAETEVANAQQDLTRAQNNRDVARESFNDLVGRPLNAPVNLQDVPGVTVGADLPAPAASNAVGTTPATTQFTPFAPPTPDVNAINLDQSVQAAIDRRPEIQSAAAQERASELGIRLARVGQEPSFSLSASGNYYPTFSLQTPRQKTAALTATISIPFYDGGVTRDRIAEARLRTENARTTLESTRSDVRLQVRQSYLNLSTAARQIDAANAALQQAIAARQLAQVRYEGQVGLFLEVTDAQAALVRAENGQVDAVYNYLIARAQFENALGAPSASLTGTATGTAPTTTAPQQPGTSTAPNP